MCLEPDDLLHLEAAEILRQATDEMLELASLEELDLNALARQELRSRQPDLHARLQRMYISTPVRRLSWP